MNIYLLMPSLVTSAPAKEKSPADKRKILPQGPKPGDPATPDVVEAQQDIIASEPKKCSVKVGKIENSATCSSYPTLAKENGELGKAVGERFPGKYGWQTVYAARNRQIARVFDALSKGDKASHYYVRKDDYTIDQNKLDEAIKQYKREFMTKTSPYRVFGNEIWDAMNYELQDGNVKGVTENHNSWAGGATPSDQELLGRTVNSEFHYIADVLTTDTRQILREEALRVKIGSDEKIPVKNSTIIKDNGVREVVDAEDPVRGVIDDVYTIVGGIRKFSTDLDPNTNKILISSGEVDWKAGVINDNDEKLVEAKFKQLLPQGTVSLNFEKELIAEIKGGVIGYAVLAVLKVVSGSDQIDLDLVRTKALESADKQTPGEPVKISPALLNLKTPPVILPSQPEVKGSSTVKSPVEKSAAAALLEVPSYITATASWKKSAKGLNTDSKIKKIDSAKSSKTTDATALITGALFDSDPSVRDAAAYALAEPSLPGREKAVKPLYMLAMKDDLGLIRANSLRALNSMLKDSDRAEITDVLITVLDNGDVNKDADRIAMTVAAMEIGDLKIPEAVPYMVPILSYQPANASELGKLDIRISVVKALTNIYGAHKKVITSEVIGAVEALKNDKNPELKKVAGDALVVFGKASKAPAAHTLTFKNDPETNDEIADGIIKNANKLGLDDKQVHDYIFNNKITLSEGQYQEAVKLKIIPESQP